MALVEVYISNGEPNDSIVIKDGETHNIEMTSGELADLETAISKLQTEDISNCGWLIENEISAGIYLKKSNIDNSITCCDKGGNIDQDCSAYQSLNSLIVSILNRI